MLPRASTLKYLAYGLTIWFAFNRFILPRLYIFDPVKFQEICKESISLYGDDSPNYNRTLLFEDVTKRLQAEYGKHISPIHWDEWVPNNAGNAMGAMVLLHASFSEYVILFGTPVGTEGHTGVHMADDYFTILSGEQTFFYPGHVEKLSFKPGDQNWMKRGTMAQYALNGFALELAQGLFFLP